MRVISNNQVKNLLSSTTKESINSYQSVLSKSLKAYHKDPSLIPERIVINREDNDAVHLFMPCFTDTRVGIKTLAGSKEGFKGAVSIINQENGALLGIVNAETLTAFRTALASCIPLTKFFQDEEKGQVLTVFGNGLQAYWHVKLALILYRENFNKVQIAVRNPTNEKSIGIKNNLVQDFPGLNIELLDQTKVDYSTSSVIFGCIPSTEPSIKLNNLNTQNQTFISIIGSYKPHMAEVDDPIIQLAKSQGKIIVDSYEHTLAEAGELINGGVTTKDVIEIGELDSVNREDIVGKDGKVILSKIVGLSIMDISVGAEILKNAIESGIGTEVEF